MKNLVLHENGVTTLDLPKMELIREPYNSISYVLAYFSPGEIICAVGV